MANHRIQISPGYIFGRLTVISEAPKGDRVKWNCLCLCGKSCVVSSTSLFSGHTESCGCLKFDSEAHKTHGLHGTATYWIWVGINKRCYNSNRSDYKNYGGRGITVCSDWRHSYPNFLKDMGERPTSEYTIDRINVDGNYEPSNCRWATKDIQARNKRWK